MRKLAAAVIALMTLPASAGEIESVRIVDPSTATIGGAVRIVFESEDITSIEPTEDEASLYAVPGLIDSHVHFAAPEVYGPLMLAHGVVLVRDLGAYTEHILMIREALESRELLGPEMVCTGAIIDGDPPFWPFSEACDTPEDGRAAVRKLHAAGVDYLKVYSLLKPEVYFAICDEAKKVGLDVVGHIPNAVTVEQAMTSGQRTAEHLMEVPLGIHGQPRKRRGISADGDWLGYADVDPAKIDAFCAELAASGLAQCPTMVVNLGMIAVAEGTGRTNPRSRFFSQDAIDRWEADGYRRWGAALKTTMPHRMDFLARLHRAGVPILAGTDVANPYVFPGASLHEELAVFVDAGISDADALATATTVPAEILGVDDRFGTIEPGKRASFFLTTINPLEDLAGALGAIEAVVFRGTVYDREGLAGLVARAESAAGLEPGNP